MKPLDEAPRNRLLKRAVNIATGDVHVPQHKQRDFRDSVTAAVATLINYGWIVDPDDASPPQAAPAPAIADALRDLRSYIDDERHNAETLLAASRKASNYDQGKHDGATDALFRISARFFLKYEEGVCLDKHGNEERAAPAVPEDVVERAAKIIRDTFKPCPEYGELVGWDDHAKDAARAILAAANLLRQPAPEWMRFAWMIEAPGQRYLSVRHLGSLRDFCWTEDHNAALKFVSNEQADATMMAIRELDRELFAFARTLGDARATEHGWLVAQPATTKGVVQ